VLDLVQATVANVFLMLFASTFSSVLLDHTIANLITIWTMIYGESLARLWHAWGEWHVQRNWIEIVVVTIKWNQRVMNDNLHSSHALQLVWFFMELYGLMWVRDFDARPTEFMRLQIWMIKLIQTWGLKIKSSQPISYGCAYSSCAAAHMNLATNTK
jgi:hypothetical protein